MPDIWSFCDPCGRWFYCPTGEVVPRTTLCPVCAEPATRRVDRSAAPDAPREPVA